VKSLSSRYVLICVDEKPGVQLLNRTAPRHKMEPYKSSCVKEDHEYGRNGVADIMIGINMTLKKTYCDVKESHTGKDFYDWLVYLRSQVDANVTILLIMDNHASHLTPENIRYLTAPKNKFEVICTPTHGSWLDPSECVLSVLSRQVLNSSKFKTLEDLRRAVISWSNQRTTAPDFTYTSTQFNRDLENKKIKRNDKYEVA
jgi:transposase